MRFSRHSFSGIGLRLTDREAGIDNNGSILIAINVGRLVASIVIALCGTPDSIFLTPCRRG